MRRCASLDLFVFLIFETGNMMPTGECKDSLATYKRERERLRDGGERESHIWCDRDGREGGVHSNQMDAVSVDSLLLLLLLLAPRLPCSFLSSTSSSLSSLDFECVEQRGARRDAPKLLFM